MARAYLDRWVPNLEVTFLRIEKSVGQSHASYWRHAREVRRPVGSTQGDGMYGRSADPYPTGGLTTGFLALVGGNEFKPGSEEHDRLLVEHRALGPAFVVPTAAARQRPDLAVATAPQWFKGLGLDVVELPVLKRSHATSATNVELAERGGLFYLTGGGW